MQHNSGRLNLKRKPRSWEIRLKCLRKEVISWHACMFKDYKVYFANKGCIVHCMMHHQYMLINHLYRGDFLSAFMALRLYIAIVTGV